MASACCLLIALLLGYGKRLNPGALEQQSARVAAMGYAVPGTVLAATRGSRAETAASLSA